jgi:hypothetical protein
MKIIAKKTIILLACCFYLSLVACHFDLQQRASTENIRDTPASSEQLPLSWVHNGSQLLIGKRWLFNTGDMTFTRITPPLAVHENPSSWQLLPSPDGKLLLWHDVNHRIVVYNVADKSSYAHQVPTWFSDMTTVINVPFWMNNNKVFVQQVDVIEPNKRACKNFDIRSNHWFNLSNDACIDASFSPIGLIHRISDQTVAVFSASEGTGGLDIIAINGRDMVRQKQQGFLLFRSTPAPNQVRLNTSKSASLIFPCELDLAHTGKELDIACSAQSKGWAVYEWEIKEESLKKLKLRQRNLPIGIVMSPTEDEVFAWLSKGEICIGKPFGDEKSECVPLPDK